MFHAVVTGRAVLTHGTNVLELEEGDVALLSRGDAHQLASDRSVECRPIHELNRIDDNVPLLVGGGGGARTRILCGAFVLDHAAGSSFLALLPPVIHFRGKQRDGVSTPNPHGAWVTQTLALIDMELACLQKATKKLASLSASTDDVSAVFLRLVILGA